MSCPGPAPPVDRTDETSEEDHPRVSPVEVLPPRDHTGAEPTPTPSPEPDHPAPTSLCGDAAPTTIAPANDITATLLNRLPATDLANVYTAILARLDLECGHELHIRIGRHELGANYVVHIWSMEVGREGPVGDGFEGQGQGRVWLDNGTRAPDMPGGAHLLAILQEIAQRGFLS